MDSYLLLQTQSMSIPCMSHCATMPLRLKNTEGKDMGCCGSCGGEAPNHINDQKEDKEKETIKVSDQVPDKEKPKED